MYIIPGGPEKTKPKLLKVIYRQNDLFAFTFIHLLSFLKRFDYEIINIIDFITSMIIQYGCHSNHMFPYLVAM